MEAPAPPPVPPPPVPGLAAWTDARRGPVRLPWLPNRLSRISAELAIVAGGFALSGLVALFFAERWERVLALGLFAVAGGIVWADRYVRAWKRARTYVALDPARGVLRVAHAETQLDLVVPFAELSTVRVHGFPDGARVMLRRRDAPDLMLSDALLIDAAGVAAEALAQRLAIPCEAADPAPAPAPGMPLARPDLAPDEVPDRPRAEHIALCKNPAAAGRMVLWVAGFTIASGLAFILIKDMPGVVRLFGVIAVILGLAMMQMREGREAWARSQAVIIDRVAGTVTLLGVPDGASWLARPGPPVTLPLNMLRRVIVETGGESGPGLAIDCYDRMRIWLPSDRNFAETAVFAAELGAALGCPVEKAP